MSACNYSEFFRMRKVRLTFANVSHAVAQKFRYQIVLQFVRNHILVSASQICPLTSFWPFWHAVIWSFGNCNLSPTKRSFGLSFWSFGQELEFLTAWPFWLTEWRGMTVGESAIRQRGGICQKLPTEGNFRRRTCDGRVRFIFKSDFSNTSISIRTSAAHVM